VVSADAILEASVTAMVGTIFVLTLRKSLNIPITHRFVYRMTIPIALFIATAATALFSSDVALTTLAISVDALLYFMPRIVFAVGLLALYFVLLTEAWAVPTQER
jgi:hypothetical protein